MASAQSASTVDRSHNTVNQAWKNDKSKFGFRMLQKMGWTEGKGLGKNEDGLAEHVKVAKKSNNLGLGAKSDTTGADGWASTAVNFNGVLEALGKAYGSAATSKKNNRGGSITNGRKRDAKSKKKRKEKKGDADVDSADADTTSEGCSGSEGVGAAKAASHCPSRARRVRSKDVKAFSSADLRAILGHAAPTNNSPSPVSVGGNSRDDRGNGGGADEEESKLVKLSKEKKKKKKLKRSKKRKDRGEENGEEGDAASPCRPRTRSMDLVEIEVATSSGKRRRTERMGRTKTEEQEVASRGDGGAVEVSGTPASRTPGAKKKGKSERKLGGAMAVTGEEERGEGTATGSGKKKWKKSKGDIDPLDK